MKPVTPTHRATLAARRPQLAQELHPVLNGALDATLLSQSSRRRVWWRCPDGHEWQARIDNRSRGTGCPYCSGRLVARESSLAALAPALAADWHPTRNGALRPADVRPGSERKVWWICPRGHEWQARVYNRTRGSACPYCAGRRPTPERSLAATHPAIAAEWHPARNGALRPEGFASQSNRRVWWRCVEGHEWNASIVNRVRSGSGCPVCADTRHKGIPMVVARPELAEEWCTELNDGRPDRVTAGSHRQAWWRCSADPAHIWRASVRNRVRRSSGCPYCAGALSRPETSLAAVLPSLAAQWHPTRNGALSPSDVMPQSNRAVWWRCPAGHEWQARPGNRAHGSGCPLCAGGHSAVRPRPSPESAR